MKLPPFGTRYQGNTVAIKLRFHPKRFFAIKLAEYGNWKTSSNGYIIFETVVDRDSAELNNIYHEIEKSKLIDIKPA